MAALRPCPSGLVVVGARPRLRFVTRSSSSLRTVPALGRGGTAATRLRHRHAVGAQRGGGADWPFGVEPGMTDERFKKFDEELKKNRELDEDMSSREEIKTICEYWEDMTSWNTCIFDMEARALSLHLCMVVTKGVKLASRIMDSAALRLVKQGEIYLHTTKQTLNMYVPIFVKLAEDANHKNFNNNLLVQDTDDSWHEFEQNINNLEHKFRAVLNDNSKIYELLRPTMEEAIALAVLFISQMVTRHERVLGYIPNTKGRRATKASDEGGPRPMVRRWAVAPRESSGN